MEAPKSDKSSSFGEVFTKRWVVELILDLVGYDSRSDLASRRLLDPACGEGAFLLPVIERLLDSARSKGVAAQDLADCVVAYDIQACNVEATRAAVGSVLCEADVDTRTAQRLSSTWIRHADFLLLDHGAQEFNFVVGNPPYIRYDEIEPNLVTEYRQACDTMSGRGDIYIGFYEKGLECLRPDGRLGFICADRWMKNAYGRRLRQLVQSQFAVETVIEMHDVDAFAEQVAAYPAITVISASSSRPPVVVETTPLFTSTQAAELAQWINDSTGTTAALSDGSTAARLDAWFDSDGFWPSGSPDRLALIKELEDRCFPLETGSTKVGIGVATGADKVFITTDPGVAEPDRLIPMVMTKDIATGEIEWAGNYLINPWAKPRTLIDLNDYPLAMAHFENAGEQLRKRHVAKRDARTWYRTIDPVHESLTATPKLLFPDMKIESRPVFEPGGFYPHHNLYYVTSEEWDLETLGGLLSSKIAQMFIEAYGVKMRGGTLRYQAQYLRRIHLPLAKDLDSELASALKKAFRARDFDTADRLALEAFQVDEVPD